MHSGGLELTKLTYTRLEDNLIATGAAVTHYSLLLRQGNPGLLLLHSILVS